MFHERSDKLERIDTGDYTAAEYDRFLQDIRLVNRFAGDNRALKKTLLREIKKANTKENSKVNTRDFSVLDVGAGSGELLRVIAESARKTNKNCRLIGVELNARSAASIAEESKDYNEIKAVRADALRLPFFDKSFDYAICSLFTHHFTDERVVAVLRELSRVSRRKIYVIDLHRHRMAYFFYKIFCASFRISRLVREDGSLSILRSFKPYELENLAQKAELKNVSVKRYFPFRIVLSAGN